MAGSDTVNKGQFILKLDKSGTVLWTKSIGNAFSGPILADWTAPSVAIAPDGELVIAGRFGAALDFGDGAIQPPAAGGCGYVAKLAASDGAGSKANTGTHWSRVFENIAGPVRLAFDTQGTVYVGTTFTATTHLGYGTFTSVGGKDIAVAVYTSTGTEYGGQAIGDGADQQLSAIAIDPYGSVVIAGRAQGTMTFNGGMLSATSSEGDGFVVELTQYLGFRWGKSFGTPGEALDIGVDANGDIRMVGWFTGAVNLGAGPLAAGAPRSMLLAKLGVADGTAYWSRAWTFPVELLVPMTVAVAVAPGGDAFVGGWVGGGSFDVGTGSLIQPNDPTQAFLARFAP